MPSPHALIQHPSGQAASQRKEKRYDLPRRKTPLGARQPPNEALLQQSAKLSVGHSENSDKKETILQRVDNGMHPLLDPVFPADNYTNTQIRGHQKILRKSQRRLVSSKAQEESLPHVLLCSVNFPVAGPRLLVFPSDRVELRHSSLDLSTRVAADSLPYVQPLMRPLSQMTGKPAGKTSGGEPSGRVGAFTPQLYVYCLTGRSWPAHCRRSR